MQTLRCDGCNATIPIPAFALSTPCPHCGHNIVLPNQTIRHDAISRAREADAQRQHERQREAEREATHRIALKWKVLSGIVTTLVIAGVSVYLALPAIRAATDQEAAQARAAAAAAASRERAGLDRLQAMIAKAQAGACGKLFISPEAGSGTLVQKFTLALHACARILATTGDAEGALALEILDPQGKPVPGPPRARDVDHLYCPSALGGTHTVRIQGSELSAAAIECQRAYPTDPAGTGATRVSELMKERRAAGCREVLAPPKTELGTKTLRATIAPRTCIQLIMATGMPDNTLALELSGPVGDRVPAPPPGTEGILTYCSDEGGPHTGRVTTALEGPFTWGAVICPKRALK